MATANDHDAQSERDIQSDEELVGAARLEPAQSSRSRLAPCASVISILREKHWSFAAITAWLGQRGVHAAESTVQRFYRSQQRRHAAGAAPPPTNAGRPSAPPSTETEIHETNDRQASRRTTRTASRPKYNTDF